MPTPDVADLVVLCVDHDDLPYDDIAHILAVPVGTVRSRIARARSALAATWDPTEPAAGNFSAPPDVRSTAMQQQEERTQ